MKPLLTFLFATILTLPAFAQSVEIGATFDSSASPNKSAYASYLHDIGKGFRSLSSINMWKVGINQVAHSEVTGLEHDAFKRGFFTLAFNAQAGAAQSLNAFSGTVNAGGAVILSPKFLHGAEIAVHGSATDTPATGAWFPKISAGLRYSLQAQ